MYGLGCMVRGLVRLTCSGLPQEFWGLEFRVWGVRFGVYGSGFNSSDLFRSSSGVLGIRV